MSQNGFVVIGKVVKVHGLKGELGVQSYAVSPLLFGQLSRIYIRKSGWKYPKKYPVLSWRMHKAMVLLQLEGIRSRDNAVFFLQSEILVRKRDLPPKDPEEIYVVDLLGCEVFLEGFDCYLGSICDVLTNTPQEVWIIESRDGKEILFPVAEEFIIDLKPQQGYIVVQAPPGLLETYGIKG